MSRYITLSTINSCTFFIVLVYSNILFYLFWVHIPFAFITAINIDNAIKKCFTIILKKWMVFYQYPLLHKHYNMVLKINFIECYATRIDFNILESVLHKNTRCCICSYTNRAENNDSIFFIKFR